MSHIVDGLSISDELVALERAIAEMRCALDDEHEFAVRCAAAELRYRSERIDARVMTW